jgi:acyl-CoA thioesterase-1
MTSLTDNLRDVSGEKQELDSRRLESGLHNGFLTEPRRVWQVVAKWNQFFKITLVAINLLLVSAIFSSHASATSAQPPLRPAPPSIPKTILFLGDSLAGGYGVRKEESFPDVVGRKLAAEGKQVKIINASIAGSVTEGSSDRLRYYLKLKPDLLVLELGGNDGLQGTPVAVIKRNLAQTIDLALSNHMKVLLVGMKIFSNFGASYAHDFEKMYVDLAQERHISLLPFLLEGVAMQKELNQSDMKHPNAQGHARVAETVLKSVKPLL